LRKTPTFRRKLAEISDHNIDPWQPWADLVAVDGEHGEAGAVEKAAEVLDLDEGRDVAAEAAFALKLGKLKRAPGGSFLTRARRKVST
jgi:hypothetical protein